MNAVKYPHLKHHELWEDFWGNRESPETIARLMDVCMPFVHKVLQKIMIRLPAHIQVDDLLQVASIGLCEAIERFDPERGVGFEGFASHRIHGAIMDELRAQDHLSRNNRAKANMITEAISQFMKKNGAAPDEDELAEAVDLSTTEIAGIMERAHPWLSLDQAVATDESGREILLQDVLADTHFVAPDIGSEREDIRRLLRSAFRGLTDREQKILYLYYFEDLRLVEIAVLFDLTEARICQIHALAVVKLKAAMSIYLPADSIASAIAP